MNDKKRTGHCMCGEVEVELSGEPAVMAYCHCASCRGWLNAPVHAAALWPAPNVRVVKGGDRLGLFKRTEASHRQFCTSCGTPVLVQHPALGMVDVPAGGIEGLAFAPTLHVNYGEKVMAVKDGLPKFKDFPKDFGGSGEVVAE
ncbi:MAG TPA: GFA family protein [Candidatus Binatia bacterium]|nr:GFA family protein [Candidatus Binatia bacterium]